MPIPTPFHPRTSQLCTSYNWKSWSGYYTVNSYDICHEPEYFAIRHAAALIDVTPLFKYEIKGKDAARFLSRVTVRDVTKLKVGRVSYLCWCDDDGKVIDDGTVMRLDENHFRLTAAEPSLGWFDQFRRGYDITIEDSSTKLGTLSIQGPKSRDILAEICGVDMTGLKFFGAMKNTIDGCEILLTRTGYTGDLGYEVWVDAENAVKVYDKIFSAGQSYSLMPCGIMGMDVARVEAGFIMNGVDYFSAHHCMIDERKSTPTELGLDWCVQLDREPFIGQEALRKEKEQGPLRKFVGLVVDWDETESVYHSYNLPPEICTMAWRDGRPVYDGAGEWVGQATCGAWSPILKKNLILAQVYPPFAKVGTELKAELTVEYNRHKVKAVVSETPFFNPERKRS